MEGIKDIQYKSNSDSPLGVAGSLDTRRIEFLFCDFENPYHLTLLVSLTNEYMTDLMGDSVTLTKLQQLRLVDGLANHPAALVLFTSVIIRFDFNCGISEISSLSSGSADSGFSRSPCPFPRPSTGIAVKEGRPASERANFVSVILVMRSIANISFILLVFCCLLNAILLPSVVI